MDKNPSLLDQRLGEVIATLNKYAEIDRKREQILRPMIVAVVCARQRLQKIADAGPDKLTARDEVALRMLPLAESSQSSRDRMIEAYAMADLFLEVRHESQAEEFMG